MDYAAFLRLVKEKGWTLAQVRCDEPPTQELLDAMTECGLDRWEKFATRMEREQK